MSKNPQLYDENETIKRPQRITKAHKAFISEFLADGQETFKEVMDEVRLGNPRRWAELYIEMTKLVMPKESNVNVNIGINKDFRDLHLLATTKVLEKKQDGQLVEKLSRMGPIEDVDYEEIPKEFNYAENND